MAGDVAWTLHAAATWFMTGLIWFVQVVHYPLMQGVGQPGFSGYCAQHQRRTTWVVGPAMLVELATALWLLVRRTELRSSPAFAASVVLLAIIWISTAAWQAPRHGRLLQQGHAAEVPPLVRSNWLRTAAWTARGAIVAALGVAG